MPTFKLAVGDRVEFDVKFTLNDGGKDRRFGMRLAAQRQPFEEQEQALSDAKIREFLAGRSVKLVHWIGEAPLKDEKGDPVSVCPEALDALFDLVGGMESLVFAAYLGANGARGRSGN